MTKASQDSSKFKNVDDRVGKQFNANAGRSHKMLKHDAFIVCFYRLTHIWSEEVVTENPKFEIRNLDMLTALAHVDYDHPMIDLLRGTYQAPNKV